MQSHGLVVAVCGLGVLVGCGQTAQTRSSAPLSVEAPRDPAAWGRGLIDALRMRDRGAFLGLVVSESSMATILEATTVPAEAKAQMLSQMPAMVAGRREQLGARFDQIVSDSATRGVPWDTATFVDASVLQERADSGTMTRDLAVRFAIGETTYTLTAHQCISHTGGSIYLLGDLQTSQAIADVPRTDVRAAVRAAVTAAIYYDFEYHEFPADIRALAETLSGGMTAVTDPWSNAFAITTHGEEVTVCSAGPDQTDGTDDDICETRRR